MANSDENTPEAESWSLIKVIGTGAYSKVKLIRNNNTKAYTAMKCIKASYQHAIKKLEIEYLLHDKVKGHPNIVDCFGMRFDHGEAQLFLEYCSDGELFDQIEKNVGIEESRVHILFQNIISGLKHIHALGIAHRDIKPENLFLKDRSKPTFFGHYLLIIDVLDWLKIGDFGLAMMFKDEQGEEHLLDSRCGSFPYAAPEVMSKEFTVRYRGPPVDIWSAGIVLAVILLGENLWDKPDRDHYPYTEFMDDFNPTDHPWRRMPAGVLSLLRKLLVEDTNQRATIEEIEKDDWFANYKPAENEDPPATDAEQEEGDGDKPAAMDTTHTTSSEPLPKNEDEDKEK
uniref:non-specific serine/threonine protein kinase n=1 Tax=Steinernema glaseri TaxID=37863 RepID=A0A1I7YT09_9BILA